MEDIILGDPRQTSAQKISNQQKEKKKKGKRRLHEYLVDLFVKSLLLAALLSIDFTLFAKAGSYNLFTVNQTLATEAMWIYVAIAVFSFVLIFIFSFSLTLQNLIVGLGSGFLLLAIFAQFALFDSHSILLTYFSFPQTGTISNILSNYSHLVLALALTLIVLIFLTFAKRSTQTYLLGTILLILGGLMSEAYFNPHSRIFDTKASLGDENSHLHADNIVLIALQNSPSFYQLSSFDEKKDTADIQQAANNLLGFYQQNNFTYYPYAYVRNNNNPYLNMVYNLNPATKATPEQLLLSDVIMNSYWDFKNVGHSKLYLKDNYFFDELIKDNYNIRIYEGEGIELCSINSRLSVNRCISRTGLPINFDNLDINQEQKIALLAAEWLESTGFVKGIDPLLGIASAFVRNIQPLHFSTQKLETYNAFKNLELIAQDIATDKGKNAYITIINLPGNLFIYDNLCNVKPVSKWTSATDQGVSLQEKRKSFAEQVSCLYGQLEKFVQKLERTGTIGHTTIIITGLNTPFSKIPGAEKDLFKELQNTKQTGLAIYEPFKDQADIDYRLCTTPSLIEGYLNGQDCKELEGFTLTEQLKVKLFQEAKRQELSNERIEEAKNAFKQWYASWAAYHQIENNMAKEFIPLEKSPDVPEILPEKEIKAAPIASEAEELAPEAKVETLNKIAKEISTQEEKFEDATEPTTQAEPQTEKEPQKATEPSKKNPAKAGTSVESKETKPVVEKGIKKPEKSTEKVSKTEEQAVKAEIKSASQAQETPKTSEQTVKEKAKAPVPEKKPEQAQPKTTVQKVTTNAAVAESKPLPKPERLKQEFRKKMAATKEKIATAQEDRQKKVVVEVKVIEQSSGTDVIPPALIDDLAEEPSSISQPQR